MEEAQLEIEKNKKELLEEFLSTGKIIKFKQFLNMRTKPKQKKEYQVEKLSDFYKRMRVKMELEKDKRKFFFSQNRHKLIDHMIDFNRYKFPDDDEDNKNKLKGNYEWASNKFKLMKFNLAKRKGIPFESFEMPKYDTYKPKKKEKQITLKTSTASLDDDNYILPNINNKFNRNNNIKIFKTEGNSYI